MSGVITIRSGDDSYSENDQDFHRVIKLYDRISELSEEEKIWELLKLNDKDLNSYYALEKFMGNVERIGKKLEQRKKMTAG